jgi:hypothetical protein
MANYFLVGCDISVNNEVILVTDFINLNIKPDQSFKDVHRDIVCVHLFIRMSAHIYKYLRLSRVSKEKSRFGPD